MKHFLIILYIFCCQTQYSRAAFGEIFFWNYAHCNQLLSPPESSIMPGLAELVSWAVTPQTWPDLILVLIYHRRLVESHFHCTIVT